MSRGVCPELPASLASCRAGAMDAPVASHVASCPDCGPAVALDRALTRVAVFEAAGPFPSAEAIRIESLLILERRRRARAAAVQVGVHALALLVCVALLAAAWVFEFRTGAHARIVGAAGSGATVAVAMSILSLLRAVDEAALVTEP
jgi:hypothetical protein